MNAPRLSHQECWELLPWLANGTLEPDEAARVEEHLAACAICREELRACRELAASLPGAAADPGSAPGLARVIARIEAEAAAGHPMRRRDDRAGPDGRRGRPRDRWRALLAATPRPVRVAFWAQAAALAAMVLGAGALAIALAGGPVGASGVEAGATAPAGPARFHVLSDPRAGAPAAPGTVRVRLVFAGDVTEAAVRALLLGAGARLVDGPTRFGVYTVEATDPSAEPERLLARFENDPAVVFAEPALAAPPGAGAPPP